MIHQHRRLVLAMWGVAAVFVVTACTASSDSPVAGAPASSVPSLAVTPTPSAVKSTPSAVESSEAPATSASTVMTPPTHSTGVAPVSVSIARIGVDQPLIGLGLAADGTLEVPTDFGEIGWFTGGGTPGGRGPVVLVGHVDSPTGPAVFARLAELRPGDVVTVTDAAGRSHRYRVTSSVEHTKADYPSAEVFGATPTDELRLITCSGAYDRAERTYLANRIVSAVRI